MECEIKIGKFLKYVLDVEYEVVLQQWDGNEYMWGGNVRKLIAIGIHGEKVPEN